MAGAPGADGADSKLVLAGPLTVETAPEAWLRRLELAGAPALAIHAGEATQLEDV
jgi:ABC-type transporter Mla MlaB component